MKNMLVVLVVCVGIHLWAGCGDEKATNPANTVEQYDISGNVRTMFASLGDYRANKVTMVFVDSKLDSQTVVTDAQGHYAVEGLAAGPVQISMFSTDTILTDSVYDRCLLLYLPLKTTVSLTQDTVIDLQIQRMELAFADGGYNPEKWAWEYGVKNEDGKYIFWYDVRGSDMRMRTNVKLPPWSTKLGFVILGEAAPSYASYMDVDWYLDDEISPYARLSGQFTTTERYWIEEIPPTWPYWPSEDTVEFRLNLEFHKLTAQYVYIKGIYVYYY